MYRRFAVRNFRGIVDLNVESFGDVTLLTGLNDTGKTSVLEALFLHASGPLAGLQAAQTLRAMRGQDGFVAGGPGPWNSLFHDFNPRTPVELTGEWGASSYALTLEGDAVSTGAPGAVSVIGGNSASLSTGIVITERRDNRRAATYRQSLDVRTGGQPIAGMLDVQLSMRLEPPATEPFIRATLVTDSGGGDLVAAYSELRQQSLDVDLVDALMVIDPRVTGLEVLLTEGRPQLHVQLARGALVPLTLMGDGVTAMARYVLSMLSCSGGVLLIDEVGAGVHHSTLTSMWSAVAAAAERLNVQIIATTHSGECLKAAQDALAGGGQSLQVVRIDRSSDDRSVATLYGPDLVDAALSMGAEMR